MRLTLDMPQRLSMFIAFLQCQLKREAQVCLPEPFEPKLTDKLAQQMWTSYYQAWPALNNLQKWVPYHLVLGAHERFIVENIMHRDVACWTAQRRFIAAFVFRAHCVGELFEQVQLPFLEQKDFWDSPWAACDPCGRGKQLEKKM